MRASGADITELFGYQPDDNSSIASEKTKQGYCPFIQSDCTKTNDDKSIRFGVCSVSHGVKKEEGNEVIICPNRLYANSYQVLQDTIDIAWPKIRHNLVIRGNFNELAVKAKQLTNPAVAFGHYSGKELSVSSGKMSMDWVIQTYDNTEGLTALDFIGIEVQSIDITGNYRDNRNAYIAIRAGQDLNTIPNSKHGLNWANVHKRLIPQIIRKGNIYRRCERCVGFFFIVPDKVYQKFEEVLGHLPRSIEPSKDTLTIMTYGLGNHVNQGKIRKLQIQRTMHIPFELFAESFAKNVDPDAPSQLDTALLSLI